MATFIRPENAVIRAEELIRGDKPELAMSILLETLQGRKYRSQPELFRRVIEILLRLCVNERDSHRAKLGLLQYRNICQGAYADKLEEVMIEFLDNCERQTDEARKALEKFQNDRAIGGEFDDLENIRPPSSLLALAAGVPDAMEELLDESAEDPVATYGSWLRFLWEAYRMCLDMLKNNNRVENQYRNIALLCFKFAVRHNRKSEFRKICDSIRQHLNTATRNLTNTAAYGVKLDNPDTIRAYVDTRLAQFDAALQLNMWQEAFRAVEDLHLLMAKVQICAFHPLQYVSYYWKASLVFWNSRHFAHHAQAIFHHFTIYRDHKKSVTTKDLAKLSTRLILAVLSIPDNKRNGAPNAVTDTDDGFSDRQKQLYSLLNLSRPPSRELLLADLRTINVLQYSAGTRTGEILEQLMSASDPQKIDEICLSLTTSTSPPLLTSVEDDMWDLDAGIPDYLMDQYKAQIRATAVNEFLQECAQVYSTIEIPRLVELCPNLKLSSITQLCQAGHFDAAIDDHQCRVLFDKGFKSQAAAARSSSRKLIQVSERETMRNRLRLTAVGSSEIIDKILEKNKLKNPIEAKKTLRRAELVRLHFEADKNRHNAAERAKAIEKFKKIKEINIYKKKKTEMEMQRIRQERELEREEARKRERSEHRKKIEKAEEEKRERKKTKDLMMTMDMGRKFLAGKTDEELANIDIRQIEIAQQQNDRKVEKERKAKLARQAKKIDYFYRACHLVEMDIRKKKEQEACEWMRDHWNKLYNDMADKKRRQHEQSLEFRNRMRPRKAILEKFMESVMAERQAQVDEKKEAFDRLYEERRKIVAARRKEERIAARKAEYLAELKRKAVEEKRKVEDKKYKPPFLKGDALAPPSPAPPKTNSPALPVAVAAAPPPAAAAAAAAPYQAPTRGPGTAQPPPRVGRFQNLGGTPTNYPRKQWNDPPTTSRPRSPPPNRNYGGGGAPKPETPPNRRHAYNTPYRQDRRWSPPRGYQNQAGGGNGRNFNNQQQQPPPNNNNTNDSTPKQWRKRTSGQPAEDKNWRKR